MFPLYRQRAFATLIFAIAFALLFGLGVAYAQDGTVDERIGERVDGQIEAAKGVAYRVFDLHADDMLYLYARGKDGDLDPVVYLLDGEADPQAIGDAARAEARAADARGEDPLTGFGASIDEMTLGWDDDSGEGYDAALARRIPEDGDYLIVVGSNIAVQSSGEFELLVGVNAPEVLDGDQSAKRGLDVELNGVSPVEAVQEITGTLTITSPLVIHRLANVRQGDTLTAFVESTSGDLKPMLVLEDFGGKSIAANNMQGTQGTAVIEHTFTEDPSSWRLRVAPASAAEAATAGDYRLLLGLNAPEVASGEVEAYGPVITHQPIPVTVTLEIDQITNVNQRAENFGIVANMQVQWHDPAFAFSPDSCRCDVKRFRSEKSINSYLSSNDINEFPELLIFNLQGSSTTQQLLVTVTADGTVTQFMRFAATLQAPDFNFRQFPFDTQQFYVRVQSVLERELFTLATDDEHSGFGAQLGEEEWIFSNDEFTTDVIDYRGRDQAAFGFTTHRHVNYYFFRIFMPILIIILISWVSFFLADYSRRIELAGANLLAFIAYNFTIANDLPRIGYLTFIDVVLMSTFVVTGLVLIVNIWFRRLERKGKGDVAARWDPILTWLYPVFYIVGGLVVYLAFFPPITI